ncbi:hypothetical protein N9O02_02620 [Gammaproteobacteria bacterium]|nr:hypothetical protein [Gammaproteobacteria bacterium]
MVNLFCHNLGAIKTHTLRWSFAKIESMENIKNRNLRDIFYLVMGFSIGLTLGGVIFA